MDIIRYEIAPHLRFVELYWKRQHPDYQHAYEDSLKKNPDDAWTMAMLADDVELVERLLSEEQTSDILFLAFRHKAYSILEFLRGKELFEREEWEHYLESSQDQEGYLLFVSKETLRFLFTDDGDIMVADILGVFSDDPNPKLFQRFVEALPEEFLQLIVEELGWYHLGDWEPLVELLREKYSSDIPPRPTCQHIFLRGARKGHPCEAICERGSNYCQLHRRRC